MLSPGGSYLTFGFKEIINPNLKLKHFYLNDFSKTIFTISQITISIFKSFEKIHENIRF